MIITCYFGNIMAGESDLLYSTIRRIWTAFGFGTASLFSTLDVTTRFAIDKYYRRYRAKEFLDFLKEADGRICF